MDLTRDLFLVQLKAGSKLSFSKIQKLVEKAGYHATMAKISQFKKKKLALKKSLPPFIKPYLQKAKKNKKLVLIKASAVWCAACKKLAKAIKISVELHGYMAKNFILVKVDIDQNKVVKKWLGIYAVPTTILLSPAGKVVGRITGFRNTADYLKKLKGLTERQTREKTILYVDGMT